MDPFHYRDSWDHHSPPAYCSPSRLQSNLWRSSPLTPRNITPPEGKVTLGEEQCAVVKEFKSPYDQARESIDHFKNWHSGAKIKPGSLEDYESNLSMKMSIKEWIRLKDDPNISETDEKFPRYSYNSFTSTLIIQFIPSPVHESITSIFTRGINAAQESLPYPLQARIAAVANQDFDCFGGQYFGSDKTPDLGVLFENAAGDREIKLVLEIGLSETYEELVQDAMMWLEGTHEVSTVVLVKFEETPAYRCPTRNLGDEDFENLGFPGPLELRGSNFHLDDEYGPAIYKGLAWVGRISAAFMEAWKRDPVTGLAVQNGDRIDIHMPTNLPQLQFQLSDFLDVAPENERTISFRWDDFRISLKHSIKELAVSRFRRMIKRRIGLADIRDHDYQPSSQGS
ncbi:MAG: hypothetical protein M1840_007231 [Geoglossum simile]|nr:MAG: hypothetical protein M1840_007231 [Geoglossum simile]